MQEQALLHLLKSLRDGNIDLDQAFDQLSQQHVEVNEFASIDHHRTSRCGLPEVIYSAGKTPQQVRDIFSALVKRNDSVLATRAKQAHYDAVIEQNPTAVFNALARTITLRKTPAETPTGHIAIVSAGTSDMPVAEEARITAETFGQHVTKHYDVGVAGLHRLLAHSETLRAANVIVVVAGMEGALASVVGGLVSAPVIAVPTSIGYGASFGGLAALLAMLNSCASGVSVVNIDNGFGGGYMATLINRQATQGRPLQ